MGRGLFLLKRPPQVLVFKSDFRPTYIARLAIPTGENLNRE